MTYNLYIDVVFLVNFIMDFLLLAILRRILKYHATLLRLSLGSGLGAGWAVAVSIWPVLPRSLECLATYLLVSTGMVKVAFGLKKPKDLAKGVCGLYLAAVMLGGTIYGLYQHTKAGYYVEEIIRGHGEKAMPLYILLLLAAGGYFGVRYLWEGAARARAGRCHYYQVTMYYRGRQKTVTALMDTGNRLYEPVTRRAVHVVTYDAMKSLCETVAAVVYIPFQTVGRQEGMLPGIFLDQMEVCQGDQSFTVAKPLVAVCKEPLSPKGEYEMLLHEE